MAYKPKCTPCFQFGFHIARRKQASYPGGRNGVQYANARLSGLVFHRSHRCIDMACNALEYIFAALLDAPHGVRYDEPEMTSPAEFALEVPEDLAANLGEGEVQQIVGSFIEAGVGRTLAIDLVRQGVEASRRGPLADADIQQRNADGMAELRQKWGPKTAEKVQMARGMIDAAESKWPGVKDYLNATGLGSNAKLIQQLVARAERRPGRR